MARPLHETLWLCCAAKRCCSVRTVIPTAADIRRIAASLDAAPDSFLRPIPALPSADDGFVLAPGQPPLHAALARRSLGKRAATCVFLLALGDGARCGLGGLRPLSCQSFPAAELGGAVRLNDDLPCSCRAWSLADIDRGHAAALLRQERHEREEHRQAVLAWNSQISAGRARATFGDFCRFLLETNAPPAPAGELRGPQ